MEDIIIIIIILTIDILVIEEAIEATEDTKLSNNLLRKNKGCYVTIVKGIR